MKVVFTFDEGRMVERGYRWDDVRNTVKRIFSEQGLPCVSDDEELSFSDAENEQDYAHMWNLICSLMISPWFLECTSSCLWEEDGEIEDILAQAEKFQAIV